MNAHAVLDRRHYFVNCARMSAEARAAQLDAAAARALQGAMTSAALAQASDVALAAREWHRIVRACKREINRLTRIKWGTP